MDKYYPNRIDYTKYEHAFSYDLLKDFEEGRLSGFDLETTRGLFFGYTFTEEYAKGIIPETFYMDYWDKKHKRESRDPHYPPFKNITTLSLSEILKQRGLIHDAIYSFGDGTLENPYSVICVEHEYTILKGECDPRMRILKHRLLPGYIDVISVEDRYGSPLTVHFDMSRWFERVRV